MGYEDLAIAWELKCHGWTRLLCSDVELADDYEFRSVRMFGRDVHLADKPSWYMYYHSRNLLLIAKGTRRRAIGYLGIAIRIMVDIILILLCRDNKRDRLYLLFKGISDGIRGISGKGLVP